MGRGGSGSHTVIYIATKWISRVLAVSQHPNKNPAHRALYHVWFLREALPPPPHHHRHDPTPTSLHHPTTTTIRHPPAFPNPPAHHNTPPPHTPTCSGLGAACAPGVGCT